MAKGTTRLRRTFTPQFKKDAVRLVVEEGKSLTEVSAHLGIARSLVQRWREQLSSKPAPEVFAGHGRVTGQAAKIHELEKKLRDVTTERDILKKRWPTLRTNRSEVSLHPSPTGDLRGRPALPRAQGLSKRFLLLEQPAAERAGSTECRVAPTHPCRASREPWSVRIATGLSSATCRRAPRWAAPRGAADAPGRPAWKGRTALSLHRHPPQRFPRGPQPRAPKLPSRRTQSSLGRRHHTDPHSSGLALLGRPRRRLLSACRRLGHRRSHQSRLNPSGFADRPTIPSARAGARSSQRSGLSVRWRRLPGASRPLRHPLQHEPLW